MLHRTGQNRIVTGSNLLKRVLLELVNLGEVMTFHLHEGPRRDLRRAHIYQFAPIAISSRSERSRSSRQPFRGRP